MIVGMISDRDDTINRSLDLGSSAAVVEGK